MSETASPRRAIERRLRDGAASGARGPVWLFDLDNTLHDATVASLRPTGEAMTAYICERLGLGVADATALRHDYWRRYGATLPGLVRHHGVDPAHFLAETHRLPGLEQRLSARRRDRAALARLPGCKIVVTNAPRSYALRVLKALKMADAFDGVVTIDDMTMFGQLRPKPDARMFRRLAARLKVPPARCVLVEDTLEHQRAARGVGMRTVWMQGYLRGAAEGLGTVPKLCLRSSRRPAYVGRRVKAIGALRAGVRR